MPRGRWPSVIGGFAITALDPHGPRAHDTTPLPPISNAGSPGADTAKRLRRDREGAGSPNGWRRSDGIVRMAGGGDAHEGAQVTKFIFVTGGVMSSLGKGLASASIGALLEARGLKVTFLKLDPYLNVDPGTMNPLQHGEVYVTEDGAETDLDLGHYERFTR